MNSKFNRQNHFSGQQIKNKTPAFEVPDYVDSLFLLIVI